MICYFGNPYGSAKPDPGAANELKEATKVVLEGKAKLSARTNDGGNLVSKTSTWHCLCAREALIVPDVSLAIAAETRAIAIDPMFGRLYYERALFHRLHGSQANYEADMRCAAKYGNYLV
jgi:hypothetical protein